MLQNLHFGRIQILERILFQESEAAMPSGWEWIVVLLIVILIFGVGRLGKLGEDLGAGIRAFRKGLSGDDEKKDSEKKS